VVLRFIINCRVKKRYREYWSTFNFEKCYENSLSPPTREDNIRENFILLDLYAKTQDPLFKYIIPIYKYCSPIGLISFLIITINTILNYI